MKLSEVQPLIKDSCLQACCSLSPTIRHSHLTDYRLLDWAKYGTVILHYLTPLNLKYVWLTFFFWNNLFHRTGKKHWEVNCFLFTMNLNAFLFEYIHFISMWVYFPKQCIFWVTLLNCFINSLMSSVRKQVHFLLYWYHILWLWQTQESGTTWNYGMILTLSNNLAES